MITGRVCNQHPELGGLRHNGGNCPSCRKNAKAAYLEEKREYRLGKMRVYRAANKEKIAALNERWRQENEKKVRANNLKRIGFTLAMFEEALRFQKHRCAICECDLTALPSKQVQADHCHRTGTPRGVLCHHCNTGLGLFREDEKLLMAAADYLKRRT